MEKYGGIEAARALTYPPHDKTTDAGKNNRRNAEYELGILEPYAVHQAKEYAAEDPPPADPGTQKFPGRAKGAIE